MRLAGSPKIVLTAMLAIAMSSGVALSLDRASNQTGDVQFEIIGQVTNVSNHGFRPFTNAIATIRVHCGVCRRS